MCMVLPSTTAAGSRGSLTGVMHKQADTVALIGTHLHQAVGPIANPASAVAPAPLTRCAGVGSGTAQNQVTASAILLASTSEHTDRTTPTVPPSPPRAGEGKRGQVAFVAKFVS